MKFLTIERFCKINKVSGVRQAKMEARIDKFPPSLIYCQGNKFSEEFLSDFLNKQHFKNGVSENGEYER
jgi:hypothetical protein